MTALSKQLAQLDANYHPYIERKRELATLASAAAAAAAADAAAAAAKQKAAAATAAATAARTTATDARAAADAATATATTAAAAATDATLQGEANSAAERARAADAAATTAEADAAAAEADAAATEAEDTTAKAASVEAGMAQAAASMAATAAKKRLSDAGAAFTAKRQEVQTAHNDYISGRGTINAITAVVISIPVDGAPGAGGMGGNPSGSSFPLGGSSPNAAAAAAPAVAAAAAAQAAAAQAAAAGGAGGVGGGAVSAATPSPANKLVEHITQTGNTINAKLQSLTNKSAKQTTQLQGFIATLTQLAQTIQTTGSPLQEEELTRIQQAVNRMSEKLNTTIGRIHSPALEATITGLDAAVKALNTAQIDAVKGGAGAAANAAAKAATDPLIATAVNFSLEQLEREVEKGAGGGMKDRQTTRIFYHLKTIATIPGLNENNPIFTGNPPGNPNVRKNVRTTLAYLIDYMLKYRKEFNMPFPKNDKGQEYHENELNDLVNRSGYVTSASLKDTITDKKVFDIIMGLPDKLPVASEAHAMTTGKGGNRNTRNAKRNTRNAKRKTRNAKRNTRNAKRNTRNAKRNTRKQTKRNTRKQTKRNAKRNTRR